MTIDNDEPTGTEEESDGNDGNDDNDGNDGNSRSDDDCEPNDDDCDNDSDSNTNSDNTDSANGGGSDGSEAAVMILEATVAAATTPHRQSMRIRMNNQLHQLVIIKPNDQVPTNLPSTTNEPNGGISDVPATSQGTEQVSSAANGESQGTQVASSESETAVENIRDANSLPRVTTNIDDQQRNRFLLSKEAHSLAREKSVSDESATFPFSIYTWSYGRLVVWTTSQFYLARTILFLASSTCPDGSPPQGGQCTVPIGEGETNCPDGGPPVDGQCTIPAPGPGPAPSPGPGPTPPGFIVIGEPTCEGGEPPNSAGRCETTTTSDPEFCEGGGTPDANWSMSRRSSSSRVL